MIISLAPVAYQMVGDMHTDLTVEVANFYRVWKVRSAESEHYVCWNSFPILFGCNSSGVRHRLSLYAAQKLLVRNVLEGSAELELFLKSLAICVMFPWLHYQGLQL